MEEAEETPPFKIPEESIIATPKQYQRTLLLLRFSLKYYDYLERYFHALFMKQRPRFEFQNDYKEGKWRNLFFPEFIDECCMLGIDNKITLDYLISKGLDDIQRYI